MRSLPRTFLLLSLGLLTGCDSTATSGTGGGHSSASSSSGGTGSTSGETGTCVPNGGTCVDGTPCCGGGACYGGTCSVCYTLYTQCMCDGVPVGSANDCNTGEACGLDAGLPDAGACECKELSQQMTCD